MSSSVCGQIVKAVELIDVWCTSCGGLTLKPLHLLGSVYYLMSSAQLDSLCQWVYAKRSLFSCKDEFSLNRIGESEDQTSKHPDAMVEEIAKDGQILSHTCQHVMSGKNVNCLA